MIVIVIILIIIIWFGNRTHDLIIFSEVQVIQNLIHRPDESCTYIQSFAKILRTPARFFRVTF